MAIKYQVLSVRVARLYDGLNRSSHSTAREMMSYRTNQLLHIDHPNRLELEIIHLSPGEAAQAILSHAEKARVA
jgi:hypothetical protein